MGEVADRLRRWVEGEGRVVNEEFLRVDSFLNHRIDPEFVALAAQGICEAFSEANVTSVLTAEASGNVIAYEVARQLGVRALYAKKGSTHHHGELPTSHHPLPY
ncbi:MAG: hypothetical protein ACUVQS_02410 [Candidatus Bipolaricaulaceae bacterium]